MFITFYKGLNNKSIGIKIFYNMFFFLSFAKKKKKIVKLLAKLPKPPLLHHSTEIL